MRCARTGSSIYLSNTVGLEEHNLGGGGGRGGGYYRQFLKEARPGKKYTEGLLVLFVFVYGLANGWAVLLERINKNYDFVMRC